MGGKTFAVRLVSLALVLIVCLIALKSLLSGASGCARVLSSATYDDGEWAAGASTAEPTDTPPAFADDAYDMVYPDLIEPSVGDGE